MKSDSIRIFKALAVVMILSYAVVNAQQNGKEEGYVPEIGQKGKDVVWVPTPNELVNAMLKLAGVKADDYLIDLGSGDGRTVIAAAKKGAHAIGVEYNPDMVTLSKRNAANEEVSENAEFIQTDLFEFDLSKATVITMFLLPEINLKLRPKLLELKPGTRIVSNTFTMGEWEPDYEVTTEENWNSWNTALMWIIPAKIAGSWQLGDGELIIRQEFQMIRGVLRQGSDEYPIIDGRLNGNDVTFRISGKLYTGSVDGNKMKGNVTDASSAKEWIATKL